MKVITEPSVYVVGRQTVDAGELDRFLADHGVSWESDSEVAAEVLTETAGRVCYQSFAKPRPGGNGAYLDHIKDVGHGSVLEHAVWNLLVTGVSRSLTHELIRHRVGLSPSQLSQRYVDESVAEYVVPPDIQGDPEAESIWLHSMERAHEAYVKLAQHLAKRIEREQEPRECPLCGKQEIRSVTPGTTGGYEPSVACIDFGGGKCGHSRRVLPATDRRKFARQAARSVLPNATETKIFLTVNARAARHFFEMRGSRHADPEIRKLAGAVLDVLAKESPHLFNDYRKEPLPDGTFEITTDYRKV